MFAIKHYWIWRSLESVIKGKMRVFDSFYIEWRLIWLTIYIKKSNKIFYEYSMIGMKLNVEVGCQSLISSFK